MRSLRPMIVTLVIFAGPLAAAGPAAGQEPPPMRVHFLDVGQGDATLFEFPCAAVLVDTGGELNPAFDGRKALIDYLRTFFDHRTDLDRTLELVALTHPHLDHTRGVSPLLAEGFRVKHAVWNGQTTGSGRAGQAALADHVRSRQIPFVEVGFARVTEVAVRSDDVIDPVDCRPEGDPSSGIDPQIRILWGQIDEDPGWGYEEWGGKRKYHFDDENNHSLVIRVDYGRASVLLTGDLEEAAIPDLLKAFEGTGLLDVDVYQAGHHGSANGTTAALLRAMSPKVAVLSMGPADRECRWWWKLRGQACYTAHGFGHPRKAVVEAMEQHVGLRRRAPRTVQVAERVRTFGPLEIEKCIYGTGWTGTVVVSARADGWISIEEPAGEPCGSPAPPVP